MKTLFGAIVVDGRGKLGGHVASKNRHGSYFRTKVSPSQTSKSVIGKCPCPLYYQLQNGPGGSRSFPHPLELMAVQDFKGTDYWALS